MHNVGTRMRSILDRLMKALGNAFLDGEIRRPTRIWVTVKREAIRSVVKLLQRKFGISRITMITGLETPHGFEVLYHFERLNEAQLHELLTIKINVPREDPSVDSIVSLIPGAFIYETELRALFGIELKEDPTYPRMSVLNSPSPPDSSLQNDGPGTSLSESDESG